MCRALVWTEQDNSTGFWIVYRASTKNPSNVQPFFTATSRKRRDTSSHCNCPSDLQVEKALVIDLSSDGHTEVLLVNSVTKTLMAVDMDACSCRTLLNTTSEDRKGIMVTLYFIHLALYSEFTLTVRQVLDNDNVCHCISGIWKLP